MKALCEMGLGASLGPISPVIIEAIEQFVMTKRVLRIQEELRREAEEQIAELDARREARRIEAGA